MDAFFVELARGYVEQNLDDVTDESADSVYDAAFNLALEALSGASIRESQAKQIAQHVAACYAQP